MKKKILGVLLAAAMLLSGLPTADVATVKGETVSEVRQTAYTPQTASGRGEEYVAELDGEWQFGGKEMDEETAIGADRSAWKTVTIPHTWNNVDAEDGGGNYERTSYWYHKEFTPEKKFEGKRIYLEFLGANTKTDLYVNGQKIGDTHKGGYTAFRYDITDALKDGSNVLDVKVDNTLDQEIAPISADFNMYGGIYRRVYLVAVDAVHVDLKNNGSSGLFLTTGNMRSKEAPADLGKITIKADIVNDSAQEKTVTVTAAVTGENAPKPVSQELTIPANGRAAFEKTVQVANPHLWNGVDYARETLEKDVGYQYNVSLEIKDGETLLDKVEEKMGFRYFWIDKEKGFYLNGKSYPLRGVNRHQYWAGEGSALTEERHDADMEFMKDLGVNTIRLCHYPQTDYFYDLCDANGMIVWTEIPLVNELGQTDGFFDVTKAQLTELIRQQYNRPSICFWGLQNEVGNRSGMKDVLNAKQAKMKELICQLDALAKQEDTTGRYTTQAVNRDYSMDQNKPDSVNSNFADNTGWKSDIVAWNIYPGWYPDNNFYGTFAEVMQRKTALDSRPMGISEYGWGANANQHEAYPELGKNGLTSGGKWHPEEYQNIMNEEALAYINSHDELWGTFLRVMFDFAVDSRNEGSQRALNDKGLVTADRKIKKDSYYLYKANWNKKDLFTYITSRRYVNRDTAQSYIKVYSNCDEVELFVGGVSAGKMENKGNGVFLLDHVSLPGGDITVKSVGTVAGKEETYEDSCTWKRALSQKAEVVSDMLSVNAENKTIVLDREMTLAECREAVKGVNNAVYRVYSGETEITGENELIVPGMELHVTAEDQTTTSVYLLIAGNLCAGKAVTASGNEKGNLPSHAVDSNSATRWTAVDGTYPQWITVDLGEEYCLGDLTLEWDKKNGKRNYQYYVELGTYGEHYQEVIDRRSNTVAGSVREALGHTKARYIRITATGCNETGYLYLIQWKICSRQQKRRRDGKESGSREKSDHHGTDKKRRRCKRKAHGENHAGCRKENYPQSIRLHSKTR